MFRYISQCNLLHQATKNMGILSRNN